MYVRLDALLLPTSPPRTRKGGAFKHISIPSCPISRAGKDCALPVQEKKIMVRPTEEKTIADLSKEKIIADLTEEKMTADLSKKKIIADLTEEKMTADLTEE